MTTKGKLMFVTGDSSTQQKASNQAGRQGLAPLPTDVYRTLAAQSMNDAAAALTANNDELAARHLLDALACFKSLSAGIGKPL